MDEIKRGFEMIFVLIVGRLSNIFVSI